MLKFRKKPVVIEAIQWNGDNMYEIIEFSNGAESFGFNEKKQIIIATLEGDMIANKSDYIIKGIQGEFYPCKADIFEQTYEVA